MVEQADVFQGGETKDAAAAMLSREQLYELVWREPMLRVGERLGVSSSYMARVCAELRVPRPPRGYWAKLEFGKAPARPALPAQRPGDLTEWRPGDFLGTTERTTQKQAKRAETASSSKPATAPSKPRLALRVAVAQKSHPLLLGIKPLFEKMRDSENGILRPFKRLMADILASKDGLDAALDAAEKLYGALTSRGHRVTIAPNGTHMHRAAIELRETPQKNHYQRPAWWPDRPTVVYVGEIPVGLTVVEMTEVVEMMYVGDSKYVPVSSLTAEQRRRMTRPHYWTTNQDRPSGRLRVQAYCTSQRVGWTKQWSESKPGELAALTTSIVAELEAAGPMLAEKIEAARIEAEEMRRRWAEEERQRRETEERVRQQKRREEARQELLAVISAWDESRRIAMYFADVEKAATDAPDGERILLLERVARAKHLIGDLDPLGALLRWKAPEERN